MGQNLAAEGVVRRQAAELREHLVAADIVGPSGRHRALEGAGIFLAVAACRYALDAAELRQSVDTMGLQGFNELTDRLCLANC